MRAIEDKIKDLIPAMPKNTRKMAINMFNSKDWDNLYLLVTSVTDSIDGDVESGPKADPRLYDLTAYLLELTDTELDYDEDII